MSTSTWTGSAVTPISAKVRAIANMAATVGTLRFAAGARNVTIR